MAAGEKVLKDETIRQIITPESAQKQRENERSVRRDFWSKFRKFASKIPFSEEVVAAYYCALDPKTPLKVKATLFAALAYFIMPFDIVPDMLLLVGFGDDIAVLWAAITMVRNSITAEHRQQAREALAEDAVIVD